MISDLVNHSEKVLLNNYGRLPIAMVKGLGSRIWDDSGKEYIDFFSGFGGTGIAGHCHPRIVRAVSEQVQTLTCHGNLFTNEPQVLLAEKLLQHSLKGKVFFCHSGAEANEAALKLVRKAGGAGLFKVISFNNCFHGRTYGGLSLCPTSFQLGFEPVLPGCIKVPFGDLEALESVIDPETAGIFLEPIQGEGGVNIPSVDFVKGVRSLCDKHQLLLVCDEVWTGPARTGAWFAYQHFGIEPDLITTAKALGGGLPMAACIVAEKWSDILGPGSHGCTMGGNPLCARAALETLNLIEDEQLCQRAEILGRSIAETISSWNISYIKQIRFKGLMLGIELSSEIEAKTVVRQALNEGLHICIAKNNVVRLAPALIVTDDDVNAGLDILQTVLSRL